MVTGRESVALRVVAPVVRRHEVVRQIYGVSGALWFCRRAAVTGRALVVRTILTLLMRTKS
jgi:hypothetical protein